VQIVKKLTPAVVGEKLGVAEVGEDAPEVLVPDDATLVQGRVIMDYGDSGDGKSTRAHSFARFYFIRTGLPVLLVAAEDSSKVVFQDLIDAGIVKAVFLTSSTTPLSTYERIVEGELPIPGETEAVEKIVKKGGVEVKEVTYKQKWRKIGAGEFGAAIFEGASTITENILDNLRERGRFPREQNDGFVEGGKTFMAASQTAYGFTQAEGLKLIRTSASLPVQRVLWTAHTSKGKDDDGGLVKGPKLVGSAATAAVGKHVGVLLHADRSGEEVRVYFAPHPDVTSPKMQWMAKVTVNPFFATTLRKVFAGGYFVPSLPVSGQDYVTATDGLIPFLQLEEETRVKGSTGAAALAAAVLSKEA
jgi:hypothetical protein